MTRLLATSAVLLLAVAAPAASAVEHNRLTMSAIGPLRLGMDRAAEKKALRQLRPGSLRGVHDTHVKGGLTYREYSYYRGLGNDSYTVGFLGPRGKPRYLRVARIITFVAADRTSRGAHVGTSLDVLDRMYGSAMHCGQPIYPWPGANFMPCRVGALSKRHIVLLLSSNGASSGWTVSRIIIQVPGLTVPIFQ